MNKNRLRDHLRRCWLIYLLGALGLFFLNNVVYTMARPRTPESDVFRIMMLGVELPVGELPEELGFEEISIEVLPLSDDPTSVMLLTTRLIDGKGDVYLTTSAGVEPIVNWGGCLDLSDVALEGFEAVEVPGLDGAAAYTGALRRDELYLIVPASGADNEKTIAALPALAAALEG